MKEFMFLFRQPNFDYSKVSPGQMQALAKRWKEWAGAIEARGKLASDGPRLSLEGKVLRSGGVTDGPFVETKELLGSFITVKAGSLEEAAELARGCPALDEGGSVEIRPIVG
jgi:hypothetical protein